MTESREQTVRRVFGTVMNAAVQADMIIDPAEFQLQYKLRVTATEGCHAGASGAKMSTHDRYCDPAAYRDKQAQLHNPARRGKSSFKRIQKFAHDGFCVFVEYASIMKDAEIGSFITRSTDPEIFIAATAAHELAHSIHHWNGRAQGLNRSEIGRPHGVEWQAIYRRLRNLTANKMLRAVNLEVMPTAANKFKAINRPPEGSVTGRVWEIADEFAHYGRAVIITECIQEGIAPGTAATQYAKWNRHNSQ